MKLTRQQGELKNLSLELRQRALDRERDVEKQIKENEDMFTKETLAKDRVDSVVF